MQIMLTDCVHYYVEMMQKLVNEAVSYLSQSELVTSHQNTKNAAIGQVGLLVFGCKKQSIDSILFYLKCIPNSFQIVPVKTKTWR